MRKYGTCFFERYAQISLESLLGDEFADLLNEDRPDLQSPDGKTLGIEVTRAMEESRTAAQSLLKEMAGIKPMEEDENDIHQIIDSGYAFGLQNYCDRGYDRLYLSEVSCLHVCNLSDGISDFARVVSIPIPQEQRREFYLTALWEQMDNGK